jgi:hypothetical protein
MKQSIAHVALLVRDYAHMVGNGIRFVREPVQAEYGTVAVFADLYGNLWDLIEYAQDHPMGI